jgi:drug/metabolite transporter (DMT)-like permease
MRWLAHLISNIPGQTYLWLAVLIFGASSSVTRKLTELGARTFVGGENPISLCNVLFVGNLCALLVLGVIHRRQWTPDRIKQISQQEWRSLVLVAFLAGALAPGLIFQALALTPVTNVVLIGRLEPPLALALSIWVLREQVQFWQVLGAGVAFLGVVLTIVLQPAQTPMMQMGGLQVGLGQLLAAFGAIALAVATILARKNLKKVPLGIFSVVRTGLGTVIFFVLALVLYGNDHFEGVLAPFLWKWMLVYGIVIVVVGQSFWTVGLRSASISMASTIASFTPVSGILAAYLILGEVPTTAQWIGGSIILLGVWLGQLSPRQPTQPSLTPMTMPTQQAIDAQVGFKGV